MRKLTGKQYEAHHAQVDAFRKMVNDFLINMEKDFNKLELDAQPLDEVHKTYLLNSIMADKIKHRQTAEALHGVLDYLLVEYT